jgi:hypothetical protein
MATTVRVTLFELFDQEIENAWRTLYGNYD